MQRFNLLTTHLTRSVTEYKESTGSFYHIETPLFERTFIHLYLFKEHVLYHLHSSWHLKRIKNHQVRTSQRIRSPLRIPHQLPLSTSTHLSSLSTTSSDSIYITLFSFLATSKSVQKSLHIVPRKNFFLKSKQSTTTQEDPLTK